MGNVIILFGLKIKMFKQKILVDSVVLARSDVNMRVWWIGRSSKWTLLIVPIVNWENIALLYFSWFFLFVEWNGNELLKEMLTRPCRFCKRRKKNLGSSCSSSELYVHYELYSIIKMSKLIKVSSRFQCSVCHELQHETSIKYLSSISSFGNYRAVFRIILFNY